jgi:hypothetical protein
MFADAAQGEFERLKEFGVRAAVEGDNVTFSWMENGKQMQATTQKTQESITSTLDKVFTRFKGGMEEQSKTWEGMMSNLEDTTTSFQKKVMDSGPFVVMKSSLAEFMDYLGSVEGQMAMDQWAEDTGHAIVNAMEAATWAVEPLLFAVNGLGGAFDSLKLGVAEAEEFLLDLYTSIPSWMLPESMEMSAVTIDALRETIRQTKEEAVSDINETSTTIEGLHGRFEKLRDMINSAGSAGTKNMSTVEKAVQQTSKSVAASTKSIAKADSDYIAESHDVYEKGLQRRGELLTDWEKDQLDSQEALLSEFSRLTGDQYEFERQAIREKAKLYEDAGADKVAVAEWAQAEIEKINKQELEDTKDTFRLKALAGDDFFDGLKAGYTDSLDYARTWGETGYDIVLDFARSSRDAISDLLFDAIKGDMDSLGDYWESFWDSMLRSMTNYIGQMAAEWATSSLIKYGGSYLSNLITFHTGMVDLENDELLAVLQQGEMVIPAKQADVIRNAISGGGTSKEDFFNNVVGAVDLGSRIGAFGGWGPTTQADIAASMANAAVSQSIMGALTGFANYNSIMDQAKALSSTFDIDMDKAKDFALDQAITTGLSRAFTGFAGSFIGDVGMQALGIADENFNVGAFSFSTPVASKITSAAAASLLGLGPVASMIGAALSPMVGLAVSGIADFLDLRDNEVARDSLEDAFGEIGGRQMSQMIGRAFGLDLTGVVDNAVYAFDPRTMENFVFTEDQLKGFMSASTADKVDRAYGIGGKSFADDVFSGFYGQEAINALAKSVTTDRWGFAGYSTRENALKALGFSPDAAKDVSRMPNPSPADLDPGNHHYSTHPSSGWGSDHGHDPAGNLSNNGGFGPSDASGGGPSSGGSTSSTGGNSGYGRWTGGPVSPGYLYEINERGQEMFMPGVGGRIMTADETRAMLSTLKQIAAGSGMTGDVGAALIAIARYCQESSNVLKRWDYNGLPEVRS